MDSNELFQRLSRFDLKVPLDWQMKRKRQTKLMFGCEFAVSVWIRPEWTALTSGMGISVCRWSR